MNRKPITDSTFRRQAPSTVSVLNTTPPIQSIPNEEFPLPPFGCNRPRIKSSMPRLMLRDSFEAAASFFRSHHPPALPVFPPFSGPPSPQGAYPYFFGMGRHFRTAPHLGENPLAPTPFPLRPPVQRALDSFRLEVGVGHVRSGYSHRRLAGKSVQNAMSEFPPETPIFPRFSAIFLQIPKNSKP